jgi:hypothetical protein
MHALTFRAFIDNEQVIRPPEGVVLPQGNLEVTIRPVSRETEITEVVRKAANDRLREHRVSIGHATGIDNQSIDADLARLYAADAGDH